MFFEIDAPILETVDLVASGRYDDYSSGQSNFSPKVGVKFTPIDSLILRGTWSQGFRIPSFNEAYGLPTTGYVTRQVDCDTYADFCAAHGDNAYATNPYSLGLTQTGDPALDPEQSDSFTAGAIWQVTDNFQATIDFWKIKVDGLITGVTNTSGSRGPVLLEQRRCESAGYHGSPGHSRCCIPERVAARSASFSPRTPTRTRRQCLVSISAGTLNMQLGNIDWVSSVSLSYLAKYDLTTDAGDVLKYAGHAESLQHHFLFRCSAVARLLGEYVPVHREAVFYPDHVLHQRRRYCLC